MSRIIGVEGSEGSMDLIAFGGALARAGGEGVKVTRDYLWRHVVLGSRGSGPLMAILLGGVSGRVVLKAASPVSAVPNGRTPHGEVRGRPKRGPAVGLTIWSSAPSTSSAPSSAAQTASVGELPVGLGVAAAPNGTPTTA